MCRGAPAHPPAPQPTCGLPLPSHPPPATCDTCFWSRPFPECNTPGACLSCVGASFLLLGPQTLPRAPATTSLWPPHTAVSAPLGSGLPPSLRQGQRASVPPSSSVVNGSGSCEVFLRGRLCRGMSLSPTSPQGLKTRVQPPPPHTLSGSLFRHPPVAGQLPAGHTQGLVSALECPVPLEVRVQRLTVCHGMEKEQMPPHDLCQRGRRGPAFKCRAKTFSRGGTHGAGGFLGGRCWEQPCKVRGDPSGG